MKKTTLLMILSIVMALTLLLSRVGGQLNGAQAVNKSFPGFFDAVRSLGIAVEA